MPTLAEVMSTTLVTVAPTTTVAEAATMMSTRHVGSALVMDGDTLLGIFTERDIVRALGSDFAAAGEPVRARMSTDPRTMPSTADTVDALELMLAEGFRHVPVVDEGRVTGIVSMRDLTSTG